MSASDKNIKDRLTSEYANMVDAFANLIKSAKVAEEHADLARPQGAKVPGELMEVFVEKLLQSAGALLGIVAELKRNALLNDFAARNSEVAAARAAAAAAAAAAERGALQVLSESQQTEQLGAAFPDR